MSFNIGKCRVTVSFFFFVLLCICSFSDKSGIMLMGIIAAALHECAHLATVLIFGLRPKSLSITSAGLQMEISELTKCRSICITIASAGVLLNLLLFAVSMPISKEFAAANFSLCLLNLLPCDPFDGGIILRTILEKYLSLRASDIILYTLTLFILAALVTFGTLILIKTRYNYSLLTLALLVFTTICQRTLQ